MRALNMLDLCISGRIVAGLKMSLAIRAHWL